MRDHGERAGVAAGLVGFSNSIIGAAVAPLTSVLFGTNIVGITTFMAILLFAGSALGLISMRKELALVH